MEHEYQIGDVVQLSEGSVDMTVVNISRDSVTVQFRAGGNGEVTPAHFHHSRVKLVRKAATEEVVAPKAEPTPEGEPEGEPTPDEPVSDTPTSKKKKK